MPNSLKALFDTDREAYAFFMSLPMFTKDQIRANAHQITDRAALSAMAHNASHDALKLEQYEPMFEDETDSEIDLM